MRTKKESDGQGIVKPFLKFTEDENWMIEAARIKLRMDKGEYLRRAVLYVATRGIDPTD